MDLSAYLVESIRNIMAKAYLNVLSNPRETRFVARMQRVMGKAERRRKELLESEGLEVPPFLIASIATTCNLQCKGCYARKNGIAGDTPTKISLTPEQWHTIFSDAIASPLFRKIRDARALGWEHTGGCTLYEHRDEVKKMIS